MDFKKCEMPCVRGQGSFGPLSRRGMDAVLCLLMLALILDSVRRGLICEEYLEDIYLVFGALPVGVYFFRGLLQHESAAERPVSSALDQEAPVSTRTQAAAEMGNDKAEELGEKEQHGPSEGEDESCSSSEEEEQSSVFVRMRPRFGKAADQRRCLGGKQQHVRRVDEVPEAALLEPKHTRCTSSNASVDDVGPT